MDENRKDLHQPNTEPVPQEEPAETKRKFVMSKGTYYALIAIFAAVFVLSGIYLGGYLLETGSAQQDYDALASIYQQGVTSVPSESTVPPTSSSAAGTQPTAPTEPVETQPPAILPELKPIYELNNDLVGYLHFDNQYFNIQYPVVQTPDRENYYLYRDFYGNENMSGCPYVAEYCDVFAPSDNVVIYGHNLKTGGMFNKLTWYREKAYWEENQYFHFDTLYERHTYQIFAVFKTAAKQYTDDGTPWGYPFHRLNEFETEEEFDKFIADVKGAAFTGKDAYKGWTFYETGITPKFGDKLVCLSTCEYTMKDPDGTTNGRWVVMGVRVK